jgi:hypothetical protein
MVALRTVEVQKEKRGCKKIFLPGTELVFRTIFHRKQKKVKNVSLYRVAKPNIPV